jgi:hypothetical protein
MSRLSDLDLDSINILPFCHWLLKQLKIRIIFFLSFRVCWPTARFSWASWKFRRFATNQKRTSFSRISECEVWNLCSSSSTQAKFVSLHLPQRPNNLPNYLESYYYGQSPQTRQYGLKTNPVNMICPRQFFEHTCQMMKICTKKIK